MPPILRMAFKDPESALQRFKAKGPRLAQVLATKLTALMFQLQSYIQSEKLSGQVLNAPTGVLRSSIRAIPAKFEGTSITAAVEGAGGPAFYGAVHEFGGTHAYEITAVNARALRFMMNGKVVFAKSVMHPPLRQRAFMAPSLDEMAEEIRTELQETINEVMAE